MAYNSYDLAKTSLVKTGSLTECYIPLWYYSTSNAISTASGSGGYFLQKGITSVVNNVSGTTKLHTLNSAWTTTQKFAFEASIGIMASGDTTYASLYDITSSTEITGSKVSCSGNTTNNLLVRSGQFTLTPGHVYGVTLYGSNGANNNYYLTKASLIALLQ